MIINHNIAALNTHRQMGSAQSAQMNNMEKLSSGLRINSAKDDAAGLSISEKMRGQIRGLEQGSRNAQDGISMLQTAEGALNETHDILQRMRELSVQASSDTNVAEDRTALDTEYKALAKEITRIAVDTEFNRQKLWSGETAGVDFQIGANVGQTISYTFSDKTANTLMGGTGITHSTDADPVAAAAADATAQAAADTAAIGDLTSKANAQTALGKLDTAIASVSTERSKLGSTQNRLEHTINNLNTSSENITAAESRIRDVDYAEAA
ncbi:flagellin [Planococcus maritimus]|nr:flagellin [Planococcus sp. SK3692]MDE4085023.1 flagellin [Planococcus maritimus]